MDFKKFTENVQADLEKSLTGILGEVKVEPTSVSKLQGQSYEGLSIRQEDSIVAMTVNLDNFYERYDAGESYENILQTLTDHVMENLPYDPGVNLEQLSNYEEMKPLLTAQMIGKEGNEEQLANIPHQDMEDMAVVYRFVFGEISSGQASILVTNQMMEHYGITQEQLHQDALLAMEKKEPCSIKNMEQHLYTMPRTP